MPEYFTLPELRALPQVSDTSLYPDARVEVVAAFVVSRIEEFVGTSFIYRTRTGEIHDGGVEAIALDHPYAQDTAELAATENGVAVTTDLRIRSGVLRQFSSSSSFHPIRWASGVGNVSVTYRSGYSSAAPGDIKEAALAWTRDRLLETNSNAAHDPRVAQLTNEYGGTSDQAIPGPDRPSGYPLVDATLIDWRDKVDVFGFA